MISIIVQQRKHSFWEDKRIWHLPTNFEPFYHALLCTRKYNKFFNIKDILPINLLCAEFPSNYKYYSSPLIYTTNIYKSHAKEANTCTYLPFFFQTPVADHFNKTNIDRYVVILFVGQRRNWCKSVGSTLHCLYSIGSPVPHAGTLSIPSSPLLPPLSLSPPPPPLSSSSSLILTTTIPTFFLKQYSSIVGGRRRSWEGEMLHRAANNAHSWWCASHIRTRQSKWLDQNLKGMYIYVSLVSVHVVFIISYMLSWGED